MSMKVIKLIVEFKSPQRGGREKIPNPPDGIYRPHLVVDDDPSEEYLGVSFLTFAGVVEFDTKFEATAELLYELVDYSALQPGASFKIREGATTVGIGVVAIS